MAFTAFVAVFKRSYMSIGIKIDGQILVIYPSKYLY